MKECKKEKDFEKVDSGVFGLLNTSKDLWISKLFNYHENKFLKMKNDNTKEDPAQSFKKKRRGLIN